MRGRPEALDAVVTHDGRACQKSNEIGKLQLAARAHLDLAQFIQRFPFHDVPPHTGQRVGWSRGGFFDDVSHLVPGDGHDRSVLGIGYRRDQDRGPMPRQGLQVVAVVKVVSVQDQTPVLDQRRCLE